jgi:hypothetical protein
VQISANPGSRDVLNKRAADVHWTGHSFEARFRSITHTPVAEDLLPNALRGKSLCSDQNATPLKSPFNRTFFSVMMALQSGNALTGGSLAYQQRFPQPVAGQGSLPIPPLT